MFLSVAFVVISLFIFGIESIPISQLCSAGYNQKYDQIYNQKYESPNGYETMRTDSKILISIIESQLNFTSELIKKLPFEEKIKNLPNYPENCRWAKLNGKVLLEILEGRAFQPDFTHLISIQCVDFNDCQKLCDHLHCNYIVRSKFDGLSHMYSVIEERLNGRHIGNTIGYDSYRRDCSSGSDTQSPLVGANKKEETCQWKKLNGKVLREISEGRALEPDFIYHRSVQCVNFNDCQKICARSSCNYIVRSKFDGLSHMYSVVADKLQSKRLDSSVGYDSYKRECFSGSGHSSIFMDDVAVEDNSTCKWRKLDGKIFNEVSEGRAFEPDFIYHRSMQCTDFDECKAMCDRTSCNYIVRSKIDGLTHMYEVTEETIQTNRLDDSKGYDSFAKICNRTSRNTTSATLNVTKIASNPNCKWSEMKGIVLLEIVEGRALLPDFTYHSSKRCPDFKECQSLCDELSCNYILRSKFDSLTHFYSVVQSKLHSEHVANSTGYDSFTKECASGYQVLPESNCTDCHDKQNANAYGYNQYNPYQEVVHNVSNSEINMKFIEKLNTEREDEEDAFFGPNKFTDFSHDSFLDMFTGLVIEEGEGLVNETEFPESRGSSCKRLNWVEFGIIPPVRDQGTCGSCYAFTSVDLAAAQYSIDRSLWNQSFTLSPQFVVDCLHPPGAFGCSGGRPVNVFQTIANSSFIIPKESCYPYKGKVGECRVPKCEVDPEEEEVTVKWAQLINLSGEDEKNKIAALLRWGPLISFIDASQAWQFYNGTGIIKHRHCRQVSNHAVLLVGYDFEGRIPYYIIKNSWGQEYGDEGYVKLEAGTNACNVATNLVVACTSNCEKLKKLKNLVQRPHSTGCIELTANLAANSSSTGLLFE